MDLSKLPKLSQTPETPGEQPSTPYPARPSAHDATGNRFTEVWLSLGVGAFVLWWLPNFVQWAWARLRGKDFGWSYYDVNYQPMTYTATNFFWSDLASTIFGTALIVDGLLFLSRRRAAAGLGFLVTLLSTGFNFGWVVVSLAKNYGVPVMPIVAVIVGGLVLSVQWPEFRRRAQ